MRAESPRSYVAFAAGTRIAAGDLRTVAVAAAAAAGGPHQPVMIFDDETGEIVELDLRGGPDEVVGRLPEGAVGEVELEVGTAPRGPGRPKLGVVSKEVTLLPRHWAWLGAQRGSVSATLRRLIDEARRLHEGRDAVRRSQDAAYRFVSVMASSEPSFEEAIRALYRGDAERFHLESARWPPDVREQSRKLAAAAFRTMPAPSRPPDRGRPAAEHP
ncbi:MAG: DUF2239 family protein [Gemmatimonadales bacterium]